MSVARISVVTFADGANSGSVSVTVPSGATLVLFMLGGYFNTVTDSFSEGSCSLGGSGMTVAREQDTVEQPMKACAFYLKNPTSGSQTFAWDWSGTSTASVGFPGVFVFFSGTDGTTPIGAVGGEQKGSSGASAGALANSVGDVVAGWGCAYRAGSPPAITWSGGLIEIQDDFQNAGGGPDVWGNYAEEDGTGSNITPGITWTGDEGAIIGVVVKASAGGGVSNSLAWVRG